MLIDAHSKWLDVHIMRSIAAVPTVKHLKSILAIHGIPRKIVTDNGPSFVSEEQIVYCLFIVFVSDCWK